MQVEKFKNIEYLYVDNQSEHSIIIFHGYGANMQDLYGLHGMLSKDYNWYFPNGIHSLPYPGMSFGRAWFSIDMQELEQAMSRGEFRKFADKRSDEFDQSQTIVKEFCQHIKTKSNKFIIGGFSQGAMLASHLAGQLDINALILFSGTLIDKDALMQKLDGIKPIPFFQSHGKSDMVLEYSQAMDLFELLKLYKLPGEMVSFNGGHEIPMEVIDKARQFLAKI